MLSKTLHNLALSYLSELLPFSLSLYYSHGAPLLLVQSAGPAWALHLRTPLPEMLS